MALGKNCSSSLKAGRGGALVLEFVKSRSFGRKRVVVSRNEEDSLMDSSPRTPLKRRCNREMAGTSQQPPIESLPSEMMVKVLCGVDHDDLGKLILVSKCVKDATLIAKQDHFAYTTPKKVCPFLSATSIDESSEIDEIEAPNAPKRPTRSTRVDGKKLAGITVALFSSLDDEQ